MNNLITNQAALQIQLNRPKPLAPPTQLKLQFWGTRGSIPVSGAEYIHYGGNTSCVTVSSNSGHLFIFDCGSGARELGNYLLWSHGLVNNIKAYILFSHTHWDHIQGFPFFTPLFRSENQFNIIGWSKDAATLSQVLAGQMQQNYFPVSLEAVPAKLGFYAIADEYSQLEIDNTLLKTQTLKHPLPSVAYRLELGGKSFVYATDHEPHCLPNLEQAALCSEAVIDPKLVALAYNADILIHDAQYTHQELAQKVGWGHSSIEVAVDTAIKAQVKQLVLYHHDPSHNDSMINAMLEAARQRAVELGGKDLAIIAASDGLTLDFEAQVG